MQSTGKDGSKIEINTQHRTLSVFFAGDGEQVFSCGTSGDERIVQRWRVSDGYEVGQAIRGAGAGISAAALSPDGKWWVCVLGPSRYSPDDRRGSVWVWDARTDKRVLDVKNHYDGVSSIDVSSDSTKFATGSANKVALIWSMTTGEKLLGPLQHDNGVVAVRFSPGGDRIATATCETSQYYNRSHCDDTPVNSIRIYNSDDGQQLLDIPFSPKTLTWSLLAWSADGCQLFAASRSQVKRFNASSGSLLGEWTIAVGLSVALSHNQRFIVVSSNNSLSFWDTSTDKQIGTRINHASQISSVALSPNDDCVATGEYNGRIIFRYLHDILPRSFLTLNVSDSLAWVVCLTGHGQLTFLPHVVVLQLPLMYITDAIFKSWTEGDFSRVEDLLTGELVHSSDSSYHACTLASRSLARTRLGQWHTAIDDAKESIKIRRSAVGHIANAMARVRNGEHDSALRAFDLVFSDGLATEHNLLLLIRAIILFECGKHDDAVSRVDDLIDIVDDYSLYITVRAQMFLLLGGMSLGEGDNERATELLKRAREAIPFQKGPHLVVISLIFGWDFDKLALAIQLHLQECIKPIEGEGDGAMQSNNPEEAIIQYSTALSLDPLDPARLLVKRSKAQGMLGLWEDALKDADEAIKANPPSPWGYERKHVALHALQRYGEAVDAFTRMFSVIEESLDQDIRQLGKKYISPSQLETAIESTVRGIFKICPPVLIDVESGHLCDGSERILTFKSESQFKELASSMTEELDDERILRVVAQYFQYVMFSDIWENEEPSFQDVNLATSVWNLDSSPLNEKLKKFCEVVRKDGCRWAWSNACCVDKTISTVLNQSLTMMYKWYEASAATLVLLASVPSPSALGDLTNSVWMTQAWTVQVALAPKVIRFYDRDWEPYLGDTRANHKESLEIMQELADAIGVARETIITFDPDDLNVREKLRLASTRNATAEEDVAYSLIGIFKSDIQPHYGEGEAALGHLLEEIVARSGDVTVLSWTGKSSPYNSCLPANLTVYSQRPSTFLAIEDAEMDERVAALRNSLFQSDAMLIYDRVTRIPPARFANRRLHLPCLIFAVKKLNVQDPGSGQENHYRARVPGIGYVEFQTSDSLFTEPFKLILVHPWIRDLRDPFDAFIWGSTADDDSDGSDSGTEFESAPSSPLLAPTVAMDDYTRALRLVARLQQPFHGLLLQQQRNGQFKRVAAEHEIVLPGIEGSINFARDVRAEVVEIL